MAIRFQIADFRFELSSTSTLEQALAAAWRPFLCEGEPFTRIVLHSKAGRIAPVQRMPAARFSASGALCITGEDFEGEISADRRFAELRGPPDRAPIEAFVKIALADVLASKRGLLVHGVALARQQRAILFTGPSGAGKSTLGDLCHRAGLLRLSDELVAVWPDAGSHWCEGTPWNIGVGERARLGHVGLLAFGSAPLLKPMDPSSVLRVLLGNVVLPDESSSGRQRAFQSASELLQAASCVQLTFPKDTGVARSLVQLLEE